ncbi:hypothetical protein WDV93_03100 [Pantoea ananatis]
MAVLPSLIAPSPRCTSRVSINNLTLDMLTIATACRMMPSPIENISRYNEKGESVLATTP